MCYNPTAKQDLEQRQVCQEQSHTVLRWDYESCNSGMNPLPDMITNTPVNELSSTGNKPMISVNKPSHTLCVLLERDRITELYTTK